eukprot:CAMPEP_0180258304 /NCGR_PEP_ID=MMETSP0987-20121128/42337_1 /TAXON_ID=697907 /ORGANISM="non described non described, Strain CCMP2293" /LENGTH=43 /DNA_ID= /DNA_START= /DNA_END= /DNA_ORIENTATION=
MPCSHFSSAAGREVTSLGYRGGPAASAEGVAVERSNGPGPSAA